MKKLQMNFFSQPDLIKHVSIKALQQNFDHDQ
jgi:hypothetical protein